MVICNSRFILDLRGLYPGGFKEDTSCSAHTEESTTPFVRFASIYRSFADVNAFRDEIENLQRQPTAEQRRQQLSLIDAENPAAKDKPRS